MDRRKGLFEKAMKKLKSVTRAHVGLVGFWGLMSGINAAGKTPPALAASRSTKKISKIPVRGYSLKCIYLYPRLHIHT